MMTMAENLVAAMLIGAISSDGLAENPNTFTETRLHLELLKTEPVPVIGANHPDAKDI